MYNLILSVYQKLTSSRSTVSKQTSKLSEPATVALVREKCLLGHRARNDHRWREILRARTGRIHAPEGLLQGLESTGNRCSAQVHVLRIGLDLGHEPELVDVKTAETGTQCIRRLATLVGQFTVRAIKWSEIYFHSFPACRAGGHLPHSLDFTSGSGCNNCFVIIAKGLHLPPPLETIP